MAKKKKEMKVAPLFKVNAEALAIECGLLAKVIPERPHNVHLRSLYLEVRSTHIKLTASDGTTVMRSAILATSEATDGERVEQYQCFEVCDLLAPGQEFCKLAARNWGGQWITIGRTTEGKICMTGDNGSAISLNCGKPEDYPNQPQIEALPNDENVIRFSGSRTRHLLTAMQRVSKFVSDSGLPEFQGVTFSLDGNCRLYTGGTAVSTVTEISGVEHSRDSDWFAIVPPADCDRLKPMFVDSDIAVVLGGEGGLLKVANNTRSVVFRSLVGEGKLRRSIEMLKTRCESMITTSVAILKDALLNELEKFATVDGGSSGILIGIDDEDKLVLELDWNELGAGKSSIEGTLLMRSDEPRPEVYKILLALLITIVKAVPTEYVVISFTGGRATKSEKGEDIHVPNPILVGGFADNGKLDIDTVFLAMGMQRLLKREG